ncbi:hypothetical protein HPP92_013078 [Vanilla planifolia]|uniref:Uncharacterized protein n=1 Tax=Vanilla planifolia TaxID=51239 RepID=A0A835QWX4_VANPL|nr:hypothetical protein HPP92_013078 [Vanilla planifolia]
MTTSMKQLKNWITYPFQAFKRWRRTKSYEEQCNSSVGFSVQVQLLPLHLTVHGKESSQISENFIM